MASHLVARHLSESRDKQSEFCGTMIHSQQNMLEFGEKIAGVKYRTIICVRAIIRNEKGEFAFAEVNDQYFLVGGEVESGESEHQAVVREAQEEIGADIVVGEKIGTAADYLFAKRTNEYIHKINTFFEAHIKGEIKGGIEADHKLVWKTVEEAEPRISQKSQVWAIRELLKQ